MFDPSDSRDAWRLRFGGCTIETLNGFVDDGAARYDPDPLSPGWYITAGDGKEPFFVPDEDALQAAPDARGAGPAAAPPVLDPELDGGP